MTHFYEQVYNIVKRIPSGMVITYGDIAKMIEEPRCTGIGVKAAIQWLCKQYDVPWHRVVYQDGHIPNTELGEKQRLLLANEGVWFTEDDRVDVKKFRCRPEEFAMDVEQQVRGAEEYKKVREVTSEMDVEQQVRGAEGYKKVREITSEIDDFMACLRSKSRCDYEKMRSVIFGKIENLARPTSYMLDFMNFDYRHFMLNDSLLIFDLDGTIYDTDSLRKKRKCNQITKDDLANVGFVKGFERMFLDENSPLFINKHAVIVITSARQDYARNLLKKSNLEIKDVIFGSNKKELLRQYIKEHRELRVCCAFGDDEKDANVYAELGFPFYIVNNALGYDADSDKIQEIARRNIEFNFRNNYLYDLKKLPYGVYSYFIDDIVVYYKAYYKTPKSEWFGSDEMLTPNQGERQPVRIFDKQSMGKLSKNDTILKHNEEFASWFNDLFIDENVVLCKIPGHKETDVNDLSPMSRLIHKINENHNNVGVVISDLLLRTHEVEESKDGTRDITKHLESIKVNEDRKNDVYGKTIYLFDDIVTSGKTMMSCVELLYRAGAGHVVCYAISRTCGIGPYAPTSIN